MSKNCSIPVPTWMTGMDGHTASHEAGTGGRCVHDNVGAEAGADHPNHLGASLLQVGDEKIVPIAN